MQFTIRSIGQSTETITYTHTEILYTYIKGLTYIHACMQFLFDLEAVGDTLISVRGLENTRTPNGILNVTCDTGIYIYIYIYYMYVCITNM